MPAIPPTICDFDIRCCPVLDNCKNKFSSPEELILTYGAPISRIHELSNIEQKRVARCATIQTAGGPGRLGVPVIDQENSATTTQRFRILPGRSDLRREREDGRGG